MKGDRYYGSDLNRFIDKKCRHNMTCINIDTILWDYKLKRLRIIESKYPYEKIGEKQKELLEFLSLLYNFINFRNYKFEVWIVRGKPPYNEASIIDPLIDKVKAVLNKEQLIKWLNFEIELEDVQTSHYNDKSY